MIARLWAFVWRRHLDDGDEVLKVLGWRTARIRTNCRQVRCVQPMFKWERL